MAVTRYPYVAREGWGLVTVVVILAIATAHYLSLIWSLPLWVLLILILFKFRDPNREIPPMPLAVVSPADGTVEEVNAVHDPYLDREAIKIRIRMGAFDVCSTRSPSEGKILESKYSTDKDKGVPQGLWLQTDEGDDLIVAMDKGPLGNSPRCYVRFGERVGQGQRCGFIHMGSKVDVFVPANSRVAINPGDHVNAGEDVIAMLVHK